MIRKDTGLRAPVVCDPDSDADIYDFLAYVEAQQTTRFQDVSAAEVQRLSGYLDGWGQRIAAEPPAPPKRSVLTWARSLFDSTPPVPPLDFSKPGTLSTLFDASSSLTKNVILGQNAIIPQSLMEHDVLRKGRENGEMTSGFMPSTGYGDTAYGLGFIQVKKREPINPHHNPLFGGQMKRTVSSVSFPIMTLDDGMLRDISGHNPALMITALQDIVTAANHDPVHQLVKALSPNSEIVESIAGSDVTAELDKAVRTYVGTHGDNHPLGYESWAIATHAATWRAMRETPAGEELQQSIDTYFDELQRISNELGNDPSVTDERRQTIVDYYSTAAGYALVRLMPVNDPLLLHTMDRMEAVAPLPETVINAPRKAEPEAQAVIGLYQDSGISFFDENQRPLSYTAAKQLQLIEMLPDVTRMNAPAAPGSDIDTARMRVNGMDRNLLNILVKPSRIGLR